MDRRKEGRIRIQAKVRLMDQVSREDLGKFDVLDISGNGLSFSGWEPFSKGSQLWCEVQDYNVAVSAEVRYSRGLLRKTTGLRFLSAPRMVC